MRSFSLIELSSAKVVWQMHVASSAEHLEGYLAAATAAVWP
jgi:hypothetical protein